MSTLALSVKDAANEVGVSEDTIREAIRSQELPAFRVGKAKRTIRIDREDLVEWLRTERVGADSS